MQLTNIQNYKQKRTFRKDITPQQYNFQAFLLLNSKCSFKLNLFKNRQLTHTDFYYNGSPVPPSKPTYVQYM